MNFFSRRRESRGRAEPRQSKNQSISSVSGQVGGSRNRMPFETEWALKNSKKETRCSKVDRVVPTNGEGQSIGHGTITMMTPTERRPVKNKQDASSPSFDLEAWTSMGSFTDTTNSTFSQDQEDESIESSMPKLVYHRQPPFPDRPSPLSGPKPEDLHWVVKPVPAQHRNNPPRSRESRRSGSVPGRRNQSPGRTRSSSDLDTTQVNHTRSRSRHQYSHSLTRSVPRTIQTKNSQGGNSNGGSDSSLTSADSEELSPISASRHQRKASREKVAERYNHPTSPSLSPFSLVRPEIEPKPISLPEPQDMRSKTRIWKSAVDPKSGRTYYYDSITRETQWSKPLEMASPNEKVAMEAKERKQRNFFSSMEANMMKNMAAGVFPGSSTDSSSDDDVAGLPEVANPAANTLTGNGNVPRPRLVRTISSMDDNVLAELTRVESPINKGSPDRQIAAVRQLANEMKHISGTSLNTPYIAEVYAPVIDGAKPSLKNLPKPSMQKRNTCGTLYVGSTMSAPDKDATIKCVCGVYRSHLLISAREEARGNSSVKFEEYEIFNDHPNERRPKRKSKSTSRAMEALSLNDMEEAVPSLEEITDFYRDVFRKAQMESDCIIMSLIYVERLMKDTNGGARPRARNWRSILFSSMIMSSKVWDDLSMWNADFSQTCPIGVSFSLKRVNELEIAMLECLKYSVKVLASEYAKYYFLLRTMLIRSGLVGEDIVNASSPLDIEGAKKLEHLSAKFSVNAALKAETQQNRRCKSLGEIEPNTSFNSDSGSPSRTSPSNSSSTMKVSLEHVVQM
eukprot:CAMPEP_0198283958 /NCGR_PEP_ID=MMETSP1449-20131203/3536_1 /TAXON_ID=420275 /ORGANISM="Attheya septentrionalis, Strain CCMP2084" /LENGTH=793 /DNA_ID=CAMNT_0043980863 /DNA_START=82 /DNA_END=2463 /DNA_ORIENTATION=+